MDNLSKYLELTADVINPETKEYDTLSECAIIPTGGGKVELPDFELEDDVNAMLYKLQPESEEIRYTGGHQSLDVDCITDINLHNNTDYIEIEIGYSV